MRGPRPRDRVRGSLVASDHVRGPLAVSGHAFITSRRFCLPVRHLLQQTSLALSLEGQLDTPASRRISPQLTNYAVCLTTGPGVSVPLVNLFACSFFFVTVFDLHSVTDFWTDTINHVGATAKVSSHIHWLRCY